MRVYNLHIVLYTEFSKFVLSCDEQILFSHTYNIYAYYSYISFTSSLFFLGTNSDCVVFLFVICCGEVLFSPRIEYNVQAYSLAIWPHSHFSMRLFVNINPSKINVYMGTIYGINCRTLSSFHFLNKCSFVVVNKIYAFCLFSIYCIIINIIVGIVLKFV